ncbi:MAG TPA: glycosyltransferase [Ignavibacteria bacterium]
MLLIAEREIEAIADSLPFEYLYLGYVDNTFGIASAFQAADVFVCPSIEDSGPIMINQSIMCGTPVVVFEMGVATDLVETGITGFRAKNKDVQKCHMEFVRFYQWNEINIYSSQKIAENLLLNNFHLRCKLKDLKKY